MRFASAVIACFILAYSVGIAQAEKRVALVIGNGAYKNVPVLMNPKNDAQDIGTTFGQVVSAYDPRILQIAAHIRF